MAKRTCSVEGCEKPHWGRGLCKMHHTRLLRHGDTHSVRTKPHRNQTSIFCPTEDLCEREDLDNWCAIMRATTLAEFQRRAVMVDPPTDPLAVGVTGPCWMEVGAVGVKTYRQISIGRRVRRAHRVAVAASGRLLKDLHVDHLCRNRGCVNPDHLDLVTLAENTLRGAGFAAVNASKTHCKNGHDLTDPTNLWIVNGHRRCRECKKASRRARGTGVTRMAANLTCSEPDCDRKAHGRGLCLKHYMRAFRRGDFP